MKSPKVPFPKTVIQTRFVDIEEIFLIWGRRGVVGLFVPINPNSAKGLELTTQWKKHLRLTLNLDTILSTLQIYRQSPIFSRVTKKLF